MFIELKIYRLNGPANSKISSYLNPHSEIESIGYTSDRPHILMYATSSSFDWNMMELTDFEGDAVFIQSGTVRNSLEDRPSSEFTLFSPDGLDIQMGDFVEVNLHDQLFFVGYIDDYEYTHHADGEYTDITVKPLLERTYEQGFLSSMYQRAKEKEGGEEKTEKLKENFEEQVRYKRTLKKFIENIRENSYLKYVPFYTDIPPEIPFYAFFSVEDTLGSVIDFLAEQYCRLAFQRRSGELYIAKLVDKPDLFIEIPREWIRMYEGKVTKKVDYSDVPKNIYYNYINSYGVTGATVGGYGKFKAGNTYNEHYENTVSKAFPFPTSASATELLATNYIDNIKSKLIDTHVKFSPSEEPKKSQKKEPTMNKNTITTYATLKILKDYYKKLREAEVWEEEFVVESNLVRIDVGDIVSTSEGKHVIKEYTYDITTNQATIETIPLENLQPNIELVESASEVKIIDYMNVSSFNPYTYPKLPDKTQPPPSDTRSH